MVSNLENCETSDILDPQLVEEAIILTPSYAPAVSQS